MREERTHTKGLNILKDTVLTMAVFHDYSTDTPHANVGNMVPGNREADQYTMQEPGQFSESGLEGNGFGNVNARIEDLGQFWLWDFGQ